MIVGHGDIAKALKDRSDFIFFASGVSNSNEKNESEYKREKDLLLSQDKTKHLVYFGSLCIFYNPKTRYARHKKEMEKLVQKNFPHYTIVRLGNITWGTNPNTLINFLKSSHQKGEVLHIEDTHRYLVDKEEFLHWIEAIPEWNCEMNITGKRMKVIDIVNTYVK